MRRAAVYLRLQLMRGLRLLPRMLAATLLLAALAALAGLMLSRMDAADDARQKVRIGVVGDTDSDGLAQGLSILENLDSSRFSLSLESMTEPEAAQALNARDLDAYIVVPDGFVSAMMAGEHRPITFVSRDSGAGVGGILVRELARTVSALVLETENAVYGAQNFTADHLPGQNPYDAGDRLTLQYMTRVLDRDLLFELETVGAANRLSLAGYYLCGLSVLFVMLWAISCSPLFTGRSRELGRLLRADGLGALGQVAAEFVSFALLMLCGMLCAGLLCAVLAGRLELTVPELAGQGAAGLRRFALGALPSSLMLCAMSFFLYELTDSTVGSIMTLFFSAVVQGYLAGCFYPSVFFPEGLQTVGSLLPAGAAMDGLRGLLLGVRTSPWQILVYFLVFAGLSVLIRAYRLRSGKEAAV